MSHINLAYIVNILYISGTFSLASRGESLDWAPLPPQHPEVVDFREKYCSCDIRGISSVPTTNSFANELSRTRL